MIDLQLAYNNELADGKKAKLLLRSATKLIGNLPCDDVNCSECIHNDNGQVCSEYECFEWMYTNTEELNKLIGGKEND